MKSRVLLVALGLGCAQGCTPTEPAAAPAQPLSPADARIARDQQALEKRRLLLEQQVLSELRRLRERRQASAGAAEPTNEDEAGTEDCDLLVFGGPSHEVFLGCLADEKRSDSVFNLMGEHGSDLSPTSMRNKFAPYGSNHDDTSACSAAAKHPPVVVTSSGKSLGLLTTNLSLKRRITAPSVTDWLARMCSI